MRWGLFIALGAALVILLWGALRLLIAYVTRD
jgi:hypothetical protein